jgi:alpha-beta hydrolase superfamily lysophospholipase
MITSKKNYADKKIIMLGHSMGSFMARHYAIDYGNTIDGAIFSGTAWHSKFVLKFGQKVASLNQARHGDDYVDMFVFNNSYKPLNKKFKKEGTTGSEWIQTNQANVKEFVKDKTCGFVFTSAGYKDLFIGLMYIQNKNNIAKMPHDLPMLIASGLDDSVGNFGKGVKKTFKAFKKHGYVPKLTFYKNSRHEILFDIEKDEVKKDVFEFMDKIVG